MPRCTTIIAYYRVSTVRQGRSGLGLEGQQSAVEAFARQHNAVIIASYTEVESGKRSDRPQLQKALAHARRSKAVLVVAKLDRLARNVAFLSALMESQVEFLACDNPHANRLTIHILAAVAEDEASRISERTRSALAAAKARGVKLGSARDGHWQGREDRRSAGLVKAREAAAESHRQAAREAYADLLDDLRVMRGEGLSLNAIAVRLNEAGHTTRNGAAWNAMQVSRVLNRAA